MTKLKFLARLLNPGASTFERKSIPSDWKLRYQVYREKGVQALAQQHALDAVEAFGRAAVLCPNEPEVHFNLGRALLAAGKIESARLAYLRALELNPDAAEIRSALLSLPPLPPEREDFQRGQILHVQDMPHSFRVLEVKKGGFGAVYVVEDLENQNRWAFKTFQSKYLWSDEDRERFMREARTWVRLDHHPNVVHARSLVRIEGLPCLWLEYVPLNLADVLRRLGCMPPEYAAKWALQLCDGMFYVNQKLGVVHRDLKPSNCLISEDRTLKVTDFGLARAFAEIRERSLELGELSDEVKRLLTGVAGTPHYMAPEQFEAGAQLDTRTDIFAFGIMFYQMLTQDLPPVGEARSHIAECASAYRVPDDLKKIILRCVQSNQRRRPNDFRELRSSLEVPYERLTGNAAPPPADPVEMDATDLNDKGIALQKLGDHEGALACYERAVWIDDQDSVLWLNYGAGLAKLNRFAEALDCFDRGLQVDPQEPTLWANKALALAALNHPDEAKACHKRALELRPQDATLCMNLGVLLSEMGQLDDAIWCYERALEINPRHTLAWTNRANALHRSGRFEEALTSCEQGLAIEPRNHVLWNTRACLLMELGRFQDALIACDRGLEIEPNHPRLWRNKGTALRQLGKNEEANECFARATQERESRS